MIGFDPYAPRAALAAPSRTGSRRGEVRVSPGAGAGASGDPGRRALVPAGPRRDTCEPRRRAEARSGDAGRACARSGLSLQTDAPAPRRGLRADAAEQGRYRRAYETAMAPARTGPRLEKRA
ncbi:hypothetical protein ACWCOP_03080 [Maricaulaceae bacterium MS644]